MVGVLTRMKLAVVRNSLTGRQAALTGTGILLGIVQLAATFWLGLQLPEQGIAAQLLALLFAGTLLGWVFGPLLFGGGKQTLRPEFFRALPLGRTQLAWGLLGVMFVGFAPLFALLQFAVLLPYAARIGSVPLLVAVPATLLLTALVVLLSRVVVALWGELSRSRVVIVLGSAVMAALLASTAQPWALVPPAARAVEQGLPASLAGPLRALPSSWGLIAVGAAGRGDWAVALGALGGLAVLLGMLLAAWIALLGRQMDGRSRSSLRSGPSLPRLWLFPRPATPISAVVDRELRTWWRDGTRIGFASFALFYALVFCCLPLLANVAFFLPFTGLLGVLVMAGMTANLYAADGTALWITLTSVGAERSDVRGRQLAWLLLVAPLAAVLSVGCTLAGGQGWAWPWVLALLPALLGGAAGVVVALGIAAPVAMADPHLRSADAADNGTDYFQFVLAALLTALTTVPAAAVVLAGELLDIGFLRWAAVPVGLLSGVLAASLLGRVAYVRLERRGSELMQLMRTGNALRQKPPAVPQLKLRLPSARTIALSLLWTLCMICLVPQGIVPAVFRLIGTDARAWFVALYLPAPWQWPVIVAMIALGVGCGWLALRLSATRRS